MIVIIDSFRFDCLVTCGRPFGTIGIICKHLIGYFQDIFVLSAEGTRIYMLM